MSKANKAKGKKGKILLRRLILIVCGTVLGINVYLANARSLAGNQLPMPLGFGAAIVLTGSMEPTLSAGDLILVEECERVQVDDIVVYQNSGSLVVHRVIDVTDETVTTQGDANNAADEPIALTDIKGRVITWIPRIGSLVAMIKSPLGTIGIIAAAIALVEIPHRKEKEQDDAQRQAIIDEIRRLKDEQ